MYQHLSACEDVPTPVCVWTCNNTLECVNMYQHLCAWEHVRTSICVRVNIVLTSVNMWTHTNSCLCEHVWWVHVRWVAVRVLLSTSTSSCGTSTTEYEYIKLWYENGWRRTAVRNSGVSWCENSFTEASQRSAKWMRSLLKTSHGKPFESIATMFN